MSLGCVSFPFFMGYVMKFVLCTMHTLFFTAFFFFLHYISTVARAVFVQVYTSFRVHVLLFC